MNTLLPSRQLLVAVSHSWNAVEGTLYCYERPLNACLWNLVKGPLPIILGKHGMAWGKGLYDVSCEIGNQKQEGDGKSPAGFFSLGEVFGNLCHKPFAKKMPFILITKDMECIDDPNSYYYNQIIHRQSVLNCDWKSSEKMHEIGSPYALGIIVQYNLYPTIANKGSAIFIHIADSKTIGTAGCTALQEKDLNEIVEWLDKKHRPRLVQLPLDVYHNKQMTWELPELPSTNNSIKFR